MIDINDLRERPDVYKAASTNKGCSADIDKLLSLDVERREFLQTVEAVRAERNEIAGKMKGGKPEPELVEQGKQLKVQLVQLEEKLTEVETAYKIELHKVPNVPTEDTPVGSSEDENVILKTVGKKPTFDFTPKPHWTMTQFVEQERAAKISGARFAYIQAGMAQMQMALMLWGMNQLSDETVLAKIAADAGLDVSTKPFTPMLPPMMMRTEAYAATARLKPDDVTFKLANDDLWLTGSSEHAMCAYFKDDVIPEADLPVRFAGYNSAFRREVGSAGKDTRGILRVHHFNKLEMESFTDAANSYKEHEFMIAIQEYLLQQLELPYQVMLKCTFDMGSPNARGVDIETWMPGQELYRETHSADYITDYQTRGLKTKVATTDVKSLPTLMMLLQ